MTNTNNLRAAWMIANQGTRLLNIDTGFYFQQCCDPNKTSLWDPSKTEELGIIDQPIDRVIKTMRRAGLVLTV